MTLHPASFSPLPPSAPRPWPLTDHPALWHEPEGDIAVIACHFNPAGFRRPVENLGAFLDWAHGLRLPLYIAELAFGEAPFALASGSSHVLSLRAGPEGILFQKEALWNAAERLVPEHVTKIVALDADVILRDERWLSGVSRLLDDVPIAQPFSHATWLNRFGQRVGQKLSTAYAHANGRLRPGDTATYHPGFGVAVRREFFRVCGGFRGCAITGTGDTLLMLAAMGRPRDPQNFVVRQMPARVLAAHAAWSAQVQRWAGRQLGVLAGDCTHLWHGGARDRGYQSRFDLLGMHEPELDLEETPDRALRWTEAAMAAKPGLVRAVADYFPARREDG